MENIKSLSWETYSPEFDYEKMHPDFNQAWSGHKCFAYDLVANLKPRIIVELGTFRGTSLFSMCQPVKDLNINTEVYAVDTWEGDPHVGIYDEGIFTLVNNIRSKFYNHLSLNLLREKFDTAVYKFADASIDILHIDGCHTYEAVRHDYETWLPKVSPDGVILFHDTYERRKDFGVYKFWEELIEKHEGHFSFTHSHGLGVLFFGKSEIYSELLNTKNLSIQNYYEIFCAMKNCQGLNKMLKSEITRGKKETNSIKTELEALTLQNHEYEKTISDKNIQLHKHENAIKKLRIRIDRFESKIVAIHNSWTWKIGRIILSPLTIFYKPGNKVVSKDQD